MYRKCNYLFYIQTQVLMLIQGGNWTEYVDSICSTLLQDSQVTLQLLNYNSRTALGTTTGVTTTGVTQPPHPQETTNIMVCSGSCYNIQIDPSLLKWKDQAIIVVSLRNIMPILMNCMAENSVCISVCTYSKFRHLCNRQATLKTTLFLLCKLFLHSCLHSCLHILTTTVVSVLAVFYCKGA